MHVGNARTAVLNWLFARRHGGQFVLRLEDTDVERTVPGAAERILEALDWLGLDRDEDPVRGGPHAPYRQSEALPLYREAADRLVHAGAAYPCFCAADPDLRRTDGGSDPVRLDPCRGLSPEQAREMRTEGRAAAIRLRVEAGRIAYVDLVKGELAVDGDDVEDFVLLRSDGTPTYHLAVVVDDARMEITHVIRAVGHLPNTPKQILLYRALGLEPPHFAHIPTVLAPDGGKLSKRTGARGLLELRDEGFHPDAVLNYLSLLGWSSPSGEEIRSRGELVREADLHRIGLTDVVMDPEKMRWMSAQHFRRLDEDALGEALRAFAGTAAATVEPVDWTAAAGLLHDRFSTLREAWEELRSLLEPPAGGAGGAAPGPAQAAVLAAVRHAWGEMATWDAEALQDGLRRASERVGVRGRDLYAPVRQALTGREQGPALPGLARLLGRERCLDRLERRLASRAGGDD